MNGISISIFELLIKGVPEGLLTILALHYFTGTKIDLKKYFGLSLMSITITYLFRFFPIKLGMNTLLSMLALILLFQMAYKGQLAKVVKLVTSVVIIVILIMLSEVLNVLLLQLIFGQAKTLELLNSNTIAKSVSTIPSTIFTAIFVFAGHLTLKTIDKRKQEHGKAGKEISK